MGKKGVDTWITPYSTAWESVMGRGSAPFGPLAKAIAPLREHYDEADLCARLTAYCRDAGRYASPARFVATVGLWAVPEAVQEPRGDPGPITDAFGVLTAFGDTMTRPR